MSFRSDATSGVFESVRLFPRAVALFVDLILVGLIGLTAIYFFFGTLQIQFSDPRVFVEQAQALSGVDWMLVLFFPHIIILIVWALFLTTPGGRYCKMFITIRNSGRKPSFFRLLLRYMVLVSPYIAWLFGVPYALYAYCLYISVLVDPLNRGPHDFISGTFLVRPLHSGSTPISFN